MQGLKCNLVNSKKAKKMKKDWFDTHVEIIDFSGNKETAKNLKSQLKKEVQRKLETNKKGKKMVDQGIISP